MANSNGWGDGAANNAIGWGQGANNAIAWGDIHADSWAGATDIVGITTDADAQAFITAAAITDPTQKTAINNLVVGMKADGIWTKMKAIYPFVGGTASTHKWNLKDPRDLDAAFRLVFNGGWTHSANGATPNGTNGYADTFLVPSSVLTLNDTHLSFYSRTQNTSLSGHDISALSISPTRHLALTAYYNSITNGASIQYLYPTNSAIGYSGSTQGLFISSRISLTSNKLYRNAAILGTNTTSNTSTLPITKIAISANNATSSISEYQNRQTAFATIGDGLTDTEAANLYTRVQAFQTSLSRQV